MAAITYLSVSSQGLNAIDFFLVHTKCMMGHWASGLHTEIQSSSMLQSRGSATISTRGLCSPPRQGRKSKEDSSLLLHVSWSHWPIQYNGPPGPRGWEMRECAGYQGVVKM